MQIGAPNLKGPARPTRAGIASAPMMAALALSSIVITLVVALETVRAGRLPASGSIGLVCALVLAAAAVAEASRPARSQRIRRRTMCPPATDKVVDPGRSAWR